jgi:hypothetical protein
LLVEVVEVVVKEIPIILVEAVALVVLELVLVFL